MAYRVFFILCFLAIASPRVPAQTARMDVAHAVLVTGGENAPVPEQTAARVLVEEVHKRTGIMLAISDSWPKSGVAIGLVSMPEKRLRGVRIPEPARIDGADAYALYKETAKRGATRLWVVGADARGVLFGVGRLLRMLEWGEGVAALPDALNLHSAPAYPLRGHQLGYRARANSWDAWNVAGFEQYIRELALFGCNAIENIPFEDAPSPHMPVPREVMNREMSALCAQYGLEYWIWAPATFDLTDAEKRAALLREHETLYAACPRLDGVFFPGGDPGDNPPELVIPFLDDLAPILARYHKSAKIWLSLQGFDETQSETVFRWIEQDRPGWFAGIVAGPGSPPIPATRLRLPREYQLRHYPDITHTVRCQYPTPWWDPAFAFTLGREAVNPEPIRYSQVHNVFAPYTNGFLTYSDGVHDDVNKTVWSAMGWNPQADVRQVLADYARVFFGPVAADRAADGILALERNWEGPAAENGSIEATLTLWRGLEAEFPSLAGNWRWQMCLLRAYYDAFARARLMNETALEAAAYAELARAEQAGADAAMDVALAVLRRDESEPVRSELRTRIVDLCDDLFNTIGLQTSVPKYQASGPERGAVLDYLDIPLNNRWWLEDQFAAIRALPSEKEKLARLDTIRNWENPGPGGCYDDIGNVAKSPHVLRGETVATDPNNDRSPAPDCMWWDNGLTRLRRSWVCYMDWPLGLRYEGLDPAGTYCVRTTGRKQCLLSIDGARVAPAVDGQEIGEIKEFPVPPAALADGVLTLTFEKPSEPGVNWREASRLTEVWLIRK